MRREFAVFDAWFTFVERKKRVMTMMKRAIGNPAFKHWLDYVDMIKEQKMVLHGFTGKWQRVTRRGADEAHFCYVVDEALIPPFV